MAEGSSPDDDEKLFLGSLRASRAIKKETAAEKVTYKQFWIDFQLLSN